tara:strand:- start:215 stop:472 length:258 start_codon:yes stop_codon:yes gene_type:complete
MWDAEKKIEAGNRNTIVSGGIALWRILRHGIQYPFAPHIAKKTVFEFPINRILNNAQNGWQLLGSLVAACNKRCISKVRIVLDQT